jgi:hypothetical protein
MNIPEAGEFLVGSGEHTTDAVALEKAHGYERDQGARES